MQELDRSSGSSRSITPVRDLLRLTAYLALVLTLVATTMPPAIASAQDASTPMAEPTEIIAAPTETVPPTETATELPATVEPTIEPTSEPISNTDSIAPIVDPLVMHPGQIFELTLEYQITTPRQESGIHLELRTTENLISDSWVIEANGTGGFGAIDLIDGQTTPGSLAIHVRLTAPDNAGDGDHLTLFVTSIVRTLTSEFETGVAVDTRAAAIVVDVPDPTPTPEPEQTAPATPEPPVETPSPEPTAPPATPEPETPASPQPETPTAEPSPVATIDLASELTLIGRKPGSTVAIGESRTATLEYRYLVGFARSATTISAKMVNWDGSPIEGWSVTINEALEPFHDADHLEAGSSFDLSVTVSVDESVKANTKARLLFTVTVDPVVTGDDSESFTFAAESIETGDNQAISEDIEGPMFRLDGGFTTSVVTPPNNGLACLDPNASYPNGAADSMIPGQIAQFRCTITVNALALAISLNGSATIQGTNTAGWLVAVSSQISLLTAPLAAPPGAYSAPTATFSGLGLLSLSALLGAGGLSFTVFVKAPKIPLTLSPVSSVSIVVSTTCVATLLVTSSACPGSGPATATATLTATVRDVRTSTYGGGGLTDLGLLGTLGASVVDGLVFRMYCDTPATGTQVVPGEIVNVSCHIISLINLNLLVPLLGQVTSISADVGITFTDPSPDWKLSYNGTPVTGVINVPLTLVNASVVSASAHFTITLQYNPDSCITTAFSGQPLNAINLTADYHLILLAEVGLSDGWASVPIQLEGASSSPVGYVPVLTASGVSFGTYQFSGASGSYSKVSAGQPALTVSLSPNGGANCSARAFYVTAQFSALAGYSNPGHTNPLGTSISAGQIAFSGSPIGSYANTTTFVPAVSGSPVTVISSTNTMLATMNFSYGMAFSPPASQPTGYYLGTVTLTVVSGTPP